MSIRRRDFLKLGLFSTASSAVLAGCQRPTAAGIDLPLPPDDLPIEIQTEPSVDPIELGRAEPQSPLLLLMNRAGYGPRPGQLQQAEALGFETYLDGQLDPESIEDQAVEQMLEAFPLLQIQPDEVNTDVEPKEAIPALVAGSVIRKIASDRQLYEAMVEFWSDHFHIYIRKNRLLFPLKLIDDREVIRQHALGRFEDLLRGSVYSPAMLFYLDNVSNIADDTNENYARELLELHTLGVHGGYTQTDVQETARALSGLTINRRNDRRGESRFVPRRHDSGEKVILGEVFPAGQGEADIDQLVSLLAHHPSTAEFISSKLVQRFVSDQPPAELVASTAAVFLESGGEIKTILRHILNSDQFLNAPPKLKRPIDYFVSAVRAVGGRIEFDPSLIQWLDQMGQSPYMWPAPNGYPDVAQAWTGTLLARWNFALALGTGEIRGVELAGLDAESPEKIVETLSQRILNTAPTDSMAQLLIDYLAAERSAERIGEVGALLMASPAFMWK